jgi:hypothetical protein
MPSTPESLAARGRLVRGWRTGRGVSATAGYWLTFSDCENLSVLKTPPGPGS